MLLTKISPSYLGCQFCKWGGITNKRQGGISREEEIEKEEETEGNAGS
jgi:hypothetical protein